MPKFVSVASICEDLATVARHHALKPLTNWLKLAANEAYLNNLMIQSRADARIGIWDWDVGNNINYLNAVSGSFFGRSPEAAAKGAPTNVYTDMIHPEDAMAFHVKLQQCIKEGGPFSAEYRIIYNGNARWFRADGNCALDSSGRPSRMLGSMVDITGETSQITL